MGLWEPAWLRAVSDASLERLEQLSGADVRVGVVQYDKDNANRALALTADFPRARQVFRRPQFYGISNAPGTLEAARQAVNMLTDARKRLGPDDAPPNEVIVFFTFVKDDPTIERADVIDAGALMNESGATLITACPHSADKYCTVVARIVKSSALFAMAPREDLLPDIVQRETELLATTATTVDLDLTVMLPPALEYVDGSSSTAPIDVRRAITGTEIRWQWPMIQSTPPLTVALKALAVTAGHWTVDADMRVMDAHGTTSHASMPGLAVTVTGSACVVPSPTPATLATATPSPSPTWTSLPPTVTPLPRPRPIYLPIALRETCMPMQRHTDAVLVLDASTSMLGPTAASRSKLAAAVEAAQTFVDQLQLDAGDQAAVVAFSSDAWVLAPLMSDRAAIERALEGIQTDQLTRIDRGIEVARGELGSPRHWRSNTPVLILLTDGRANPGPAVAAVEQAWLAKDAGVVVFTVGLGSDLDDDALAQMASRPGYFYTTPDAEDLADIYRAIAVSIPCPAESFWGRRQ